MSPAAPRGTDAIDVPGVSGKNILDGGTKSNFHVGDAVTLFGITPTSKAIAWVDNQGTGSATGLTLHATQAGAPTASFTLAGYTTADLSNGRLGAVYGAEADGAPYLYVTGLK